MLEVVVREEIYQIAFAWKNLKGRHILEKIGGAAILRKFCIQNNHLLSSLNEDLGYRVSTLLVQNRTS